MGYLIAADRYFKRDEIGYITQINVLPEHRRSLVAASLLQAQFDRSAGRKESKSVLPTTHHPPPTRASRARIHIFWQKRVRADDASTPWWYPSQTGGGEMCEDRLVFPIPPGVSWRDVLPVILDTELRPSGSGSGSGSGIVTTEGRPLPDGRGSSESRPNSSESRPKKPRVKKVLKSPRMKGGLWFEEEGIVERTEPRASASGESKEKPKIDPRLTKMARELRDVWTERQAPMILPNAAKHDARRMIGADQSEASVQIPRSLSLPEAA